MHKVLIYHGNCDFSKRLQADLASREWSVDMCCGMLEMLRLIEEGDYDVVILSSDHMNVELSVLMGTIRSLAKNPRIIINLSETVDNMAISALTPNETIVRGDLTPEKLQRVFGK